MRRYLIEDARCRPGMFPSQPRQGNETATIDEPKANLARHIDGLLSELYSFHPQLPATVELKFFLGLSDDECADVLGLDLRTFQRRWQEARWWLYQRVPMEECSC